MLRDDLGGTDEGPPVVWADAQGVHFLRPSRGSGTRTRADLVTFADGRARARAEDAASRSCRGSSRRRCARGPRERVDFSASLAGGAPLGPGMEYEWYFDGTGTVRGANVSHRFPRAGTYLVLLNVVRGDGDVDRRAGHGARARRAPRSAARRRSGDAHGRRTRRADGGGVAVPAAAVTRARGGGRGRSGTAAAAPARARRARAAAPPTASAPPPPRPPRAGRAAAADRGASSSAVP